MKQVASSKKLFNGKVPVLATSSLDTDLVMFLEDALFVLVVVCDSNPCSNEGSCLADGDTFSCTCQPGFSGDLCQIGTFEMCFW